MNATRLEWARERAEAEFDQEAAILRRAPGTGDGGGGRRPGAESVVATVGCMIEAPRQLEEAPTGGRVTATSLRRIHLPVGTDVRPRDVLRIAGSRYEVTGDTGDASGMTTLAVLARKSD